MPFSSGTFSLYSPGNPVVTGTTISSTWANNTLSDIASGLSTCVLKDGTQTLTANQAMSGFKFTGLGSGSAAADSVTVAQLQNQFGSFLTSVAGTNTITAIATPTPTYTIGQRFTFVPANTNTGATTLNISSLGGGAVQLAGAALTGGELVASVPVTVYVTAATPVFEIVTPTQFPDSRALVVGATDSTKKLFEVDGFTTGNTRVATPPNRDFTIGDASVLGTEQATTSGTAIDFTSIPTWVKKITVNLIGVSTNGTSILILQIGDSGGIENTGYAGSTAGVSAGVSAALAYSAGFITDTRVSASAVRQGSIVLTLEDSSDNTWTARVLVASTDAAQIDSGAGSKALSATLDRVRLTATNGTDAFDAGAVNIVYE